MLAYTLMASALMLVDRHSPICEARSDVEIYILEDMDDGRLPAASFRVVESIRGSRTGEITLAQQYAGEPEMGPFSGLTTFRSGTRRFAHVRGDVLLVTSRTNDCGTTPPPVEGVPSGRETQYEVLLRRARAYVAFESAPTPGNLIRLIESNDPVHRSLATHFVLRLSLENSPELIGPVVRSATRLAIRAYRDGRFADDFESEQWVMLADLTRHVEAWLTQGMSRPDWVSDLARLLLVLEIEDLVTPRTSNSPCALLNRLGFSGRCSRGPAGPLREEDRERLAVELQLDRFPVISE